MGPIPIRTCYGRPASLAERGRLVSPSRKGWLLSCALAVATVTVVAASLPPWAGEASLGLRATDSRGRPVVGAEVTLVHEALNGGPPMLSTNVEGKLEVGALADGTWRVQVKKPGHMTYSGLIHLQAGKKPKELLASLEVADDSGGPLRVKLYRAKAQGYSWAGWEEEEETVAPAPSAPVKEEPEPEPEPTTPQPLVPPELVEGDPEGDSARGAGEEETAEVKEAKVVAPEAPAVAEPEPVADPSVVPPAPAVAAADPEPIPEPAPEVDDTPSVVPAAPVAAEPAPVAGPAPEPVGAPLSLRGLGDAMRSAGRGNCPDCPPGEWAVTDELELAPGQGVSKGCEQGVRKRMEELAQLVGEGLGKKQAVARYELVATGQLGRVLTQPGQCGLLAVVLPAGTRFRGYRYEVEDENGSGDCLSHHPCSIGDCRWLGDPELIRSGGPTVVYGLFLNSSESLSRRARLHVYVASGGRP